MNTNEVARIAALVGEPARTAMLLELLDGRALTANELARAAGVQPPTASRHLAQLAEAGLLSVSPRGRHRYHRLASPAVAGVLEGIMQLAASTRSSAAPTPIIGPKDAALRQARSCYDHIGGRLGVAIAERLVDTGAVSIDGENARVQPACRVQLGRLGIDFDAAVAERGGSRTVCRPCLDWSERRSHLAGALGAVVLAHGLERGWLRRRAGTRALEISAGGAAVWREWLGTAAWQRVSGAPAAPIDRVARRSGEVAATT